jgi:chromosome segregation ATPase
MLWEKKVQLVKETQMAIDPNVGAAETREMEQEIHRMKLRYEQLKKLQEKMITDMERAIYRHVDISDKATKQRTRDPATNTTSAVQRATQKQIQDITRRLKQILSEIKECDQSATQLMDTQGQVTKQIQATEEMCKHLESRQQELLSVELERLEKRYVNLNKITSLQNRARRFMDIKSGKYTFAVKEPELRDSELSKQRTRTKKIVDIARGLQTDYGSMLGSAYRDAGLAGFLRD